MFQQALETVSKQVLIRNRYGNFIGGEWIAPLKGGYFDNISPTTGQVICQIPRSQAEDVERAIEAAHAAAPKWGRTAVAERVSNRRSNSSRTNTAPAIGALKAVASPAPAPAANKTRESSSPRLKIRATMSAIEGPICTLGPSRPSASPDPIASTPPTNLTNALRMGRPRLPPRIAVQRSLPSRRDTDGGIRHRLFIYLAPARSGRSTGLQPGEISSNIQRALQAAEKHFYFLPYLPRGIFFLRCGSVSAMN